MIKGQGLGFTCHSTVTLKLLQIVLSLKRTKPTLSLVKKLKACVLCPVQQTGSYWDKPTVLPLPGVEPKQR